LKKTICSKEQKRNLVIWPRSRQSKYKQLLFYSSANLLVSRCNLRGPNGPSESNHMDTVPLRSPKFRLQRVVHNFFHERIVAKFRNPRGLPIDKRALYKRPDTFSQHRKAKECTSNRITHRRANRIHYCNGTSAGKRLVDLKRLQRPTRGIS
jgi:hypothetical protein